MLRVGMLGEPPSLDVHWTTAAITDILGNHLFEGLYTLDADQRPTPMLAAVLEKVPVIGYADLFGLRAARKTVQGFDEKTDRPRFYNEWLEK